MRSGFPIYSALLLACTRTGMLAAAEALPGVEPDPLLRSPLERILECPGWGTALLVLSGAILVLIVLCTRAAGEAFRAGAPAAFARLPARLDAEGLEELRGGAGAAAPVLVRALRVGLVAGRGGLLISKSAVLGAWESERGHFRFWPRVMLAAGLGSLLLSLLAAVAQFPLDLADWRKAYPDAAAPALRDWAGLLSHSHALLTWGLTNAFVALVLYFIFERVTQAYLERTTRALVAYLGEPAADEVARYPAASG